MPLLGLLAAGAVGGYARGNIESEKAKLSVFKDILDKDIAHQYDMRRAEAVAAVNRGEAYYKHGLGLQRIQAKTESDLAKNAAREESTTKIETLKAEQRLQGQKLRDEAAMTRARFIQQQANARTNITQAGANARKQAELELRRQIMEGKADMANQIAAPQDKSKKLKTGDVDLSSIEMFLK